MAAAVTLDGGCDTPDVLRRLAIVFADFESALAQTPLIRKLTRGRFTVEDYRGFLCGLRQARSGCPGPPPTCRRPGWSCARA